MPAAWRERCNPRAGWLDGRSLAGLEGPVQRRGSTTFQVSVVVQPAQRIPQHGPRPVEDRRATGGKVTGGGAIRMVAKHGFSERGAQLNRAGGRFRAQDGVEVA